MAGGTFLSQNKTRPGVYINFKAIIESLSSLGTRGIMTMPVAMSWGAPLTELLSTDLVDGKSLAKIGYTVYDAESQIYREALKHAYKALIYRLDTGGVKATGTITPLTITAKYTGIVGNGISVSVIVNGASFDVVTYYLGAEKDRQTATAIVSLISNAWVDFSGTGNLVANAGVTLVTGANGTVSDATYTTYLNAIKSYKWNTMGIPQNSAAAVLAVKTFINDQRENLGKRVQAVVFNATADYEGIINVRQGYTTATETISPETFVAFMAGLSAGSEMNISNTYKVIEGATSITYPIGVTPYGDAEIESALAVGDLVLSARQDGAIVIEKDINSLHTFTINKSYSFSKNRVIRTLDEINNSLKSVFEIGYIGKVDNNDYGRNVFKGDVIAYLNKLQNANAIQNFDSATDVTVGPGLSIDSVVASLAIQPVDAMEKIYMTVMVG